MTDADDLTADELEQLARSLAVDGSLGRADTLRVVEVLRALAAVRRVDGWGLTGASASLSTMSPALLSVLAGTERKWSKWVEVCGCLSW